MRDLHRQTMWAAIAAGKLIQEIYILDPTNLLIRKKQIYSAVYNYWVVGLYKPFGLYYPCKPKYGSWKA